LYAAYGFQVAERVKVPTSTGLTIPLTRMTKFISKKQMMCFCNINAEET
jgi:hypothetical protein